MKDDLFNELPTSVKEGGGILRGDDSPARTFALPDPKVRRIRARLGFSQSAFASLFGITVRTLQSWEQGRRIPDGPTRLLLQIAAKHPEVLSEIAHSSGTRPKSRKLRRATKPAKIRA